MSQMPAQSQCRLYFGILAALSGLAVFLKQQLVFEPNHKVIPLQYLCSFAYLKYCFLFNNCVTFDFSESEVTFPVRMTRPVTPLLYISHNKSELLELRKHVFIKDAHEGKNDTQASCHVYGCSGGHSR